MRTRHVLAGLAAAGGLAPVVATTNAFHHQFGAYRTASGKGPITVQWSGVRLWVK
jgi:hypothetical protein